MCMSVCVCILEMMQFPHQRRFQIKKINFGTIFTIKNAHACVLEKSEFGKTQLKKIKHSNTFLDNSGVPKSMQLLSSKEICGTNMHVHDPPHLNSIKAEVSSEQLGGMVMNPRHFWNCQASASYSPMHGSI